MNTLEVLKAARERIAVPERWTQGRAAVDAAGESCYAASPMARAWCLLGAIYWVAPDDSECRVECVRHLSAGNIEDGALVAFNDSHKHSEVLALFDKAIARLESEQ